jgi:hypothetical protein
VSGRWALAWVRPGPAADDAAWSDASSLPAPRLYPLREIFGFRVEVVQCAQGAARRAARAGDTACSTAAPLPTRRQQVVALAELSIYWAAAVQDKQIGKKVLRVWGNIPSTNYLQLPRKKTDSLGLTGRFLYVQVRAVAAERESRETERECGNWWHAKARPDRA